MRDAARAPPPPPPRAPPRDFLGGIVEVKFNGASNTVLLMKLSRSVKTCCCLVNLVQDVGIQSQNEMKNFFDHKHSGNQIQDEMSCLYFESSVHASVLRSVVKWKVRWRYIVEPQVVVVNGLQG